MSGIEIAGLLLGVIPTILPFLDHYSRRIWVVAVRREYVIRLKHALLEQKVFLEANIKFFLGKVGIDDWPDTTEDLLELLRSEGVDKELQEKLGRDAHEIYRVRVGECEKLVQNLIRHIEGLSPNPILTSGSIDLMEVIRNHAPGKAGAPQPWKRFKLLFATRDIEKSIKELDHATQRLGRLQTSVFQTGFGSRNSSAKTAKQLAASLARVRLSLKRLYQELRPVWSEECRKQHQVKLFLQPRVGAKCLGISEFGVPLDQQYGDILSVHSVIFLCGVRSVSRTGVKAKLVVSSAALESSNDPENHKECRNKRERKQSSKPSVTWTDSSFEAKTSIPNNPFARICTRMQVEDWSHTPFMVYLVDDGRLKAERHSSLDMEEWCRPASSLPLSACLDSSRADDGFRMSLRDRLALALNLCSNTLQLQSTEWLPRTWFKQGIQFLRFTDIYSPELATDFSRPFIETLIQSYSGDLGMGSAPKPGLALLDLGIILLELWHEKSLESQFPDMDSSSYLQRLVLAREWFENTIDTLPDKYCDAVSQCLQPHIQGSASELDWDDALFQQGVCQSVIFPIFKLCNEWRASETLMK